MSEEKLPGLAHVYNEEIDYWETRAMTAELKIKDWSVRLVEQEERIAKAKAILTASIPQSQLALEIIRAVEVLEGK